MAAFLASDNRAGARRAGTYYHALTQEALAVQGVVDKATQRAAWYARDNQNTVMEAGIYNLTEDQGEIFPRVGTAGRAEYSIPYGTVL